MKFLSTDYPQPVVLLPGSAKGNNPKSQNIYFSTCNNSGKGLGEETKLLTKQPFMTNKKMHDVKRCKEQWI